MIEVFFNFPRKPMADSPVPANLTIHFQIKHFANCTLLPIWHVHQVQMIGNRFMSCAQLTFF